MWQILSGSHVNLLFSDAFQNPAAGEEVEFIGNTLFDAFNFLKN